MKIKAPAVERVHVATRYQSDFILDETTLVTVKDRQRVTPIYAIRPTTVTVVDHDFRLADRLKASAGLVIVAGLTAAGLVAVPVIATYFIARDLVGSAIENIKEASEAFGYVLSEGADAFRGLASEITRP